MSSSRVPSSASCAVLSSGVAEVQLQDPVEPRPQLVLVGHVPEDAAAVPVAEVVLPVCRYPPDTKRADRSVDQVQERARLPKTSVDPVPGWACSSTRSRPPRTSFSPQGVFTPATRETRPVARRSPSSGRPTAAAGRRSRGPRGRSCARLYACLRDRSSSRSRTLSGHARGEEKPVPKPYETRAVNGSRPATRTPRPGPPRPCRSAPSRGRARKPRAVKPSLPRALKVGSPQRQIEQAPTGDGADTTPTKVAARTAARDASDAGLRGQSKAPCREED